MKVLGSICVFLSLLGVVSSRLCGSPAVAIAEDARTEASGKWLLGVWEGTERRSGFSENVTVEFKEEAGGIVWEFSGRMGGGAYGGRVLRGGGWATVSGDSVAMKGRYGNGQPLSFSLTRKGGTLEGSGVGGNVGLDGVSWKKAR